MKYIVPVLLLMFVSSSALAAKGGGHQKLVEYDYHDFLNSSIQSKTFERYENGVEFDFEWTFDRTTIPGAVLRTEIAKDSSGEITRYTQSVFTPATESFGLREARRYDPNNTAAPVDTTVYTPAVDILTDAMIPGVAWVSAGKMDSTSSGESYYAEKSEVVAVENVTVPYGTFTGCLKIHRTSQYGVSLYTRVDWVCPGMGVVKRINNGRVLIELDGVTY